MPSKGSALVISLAVLAASACGGGSSSGGGGSVAGVCTFRVVGSGKVTVHLETKSSNTAIIKETESDCKAAAKAANTTRWNCGISYLTEYFPTVERTGDTYRLVTNFPRQNNISTRTGVTRSELPPLIEMAGVGSWMVDQGLDAWSCSARGG